MGNQKPKMRQVLDWPEGTQMPDTTKEEARHTICDADAARPCSSSKRRLWRWRTNVARSTQFVMMSAMLF